MAAKTPKKFRQARKAARKDAKKIFSGKTQAGLKDKNPLNKFSADDVKALSEVKDEAKGKFITDDRGNKIRTTNVTPQEGAAEFKRTRAASMEEFRSKMRAEFGEYGGKKATQADYDSNPKFKDRAPKAGPDKPTPKTTAAGKVRSAVTVNELKPQGKVVKKAVVKKAALTKTAKPTVAKKGFSAGKQLNAEGKAMYDKFIKEGIKPKSALNKALFRQEKGAKVAAKAAGPIAIAAKKAAAKTAPIKVKSTVVSSKPNVPGKELAIRPKPGAVVAKAASSSAKKKFTAKGAALGAAKGAGKLLTGKVALAATVGSLALGPIQRKLSEGTKGRTTYDNLNAIAERSKKDGTVYTRSGDKPMQNASYGRAVPGAGGATIASIPKANAGTPRKETQKLRGPVKRTPATGPTMDYKVENKDTLSAIAKRSGITLSELMALNKKIKDPRKIYRNTNIKIPAPGKVPDPMYTGPVPYRPGSKAAIAYEALRASRKK